MSHQSPPTLHFSLPDGTKRLASLLQRGILIPCSGSTDLESLLLLLPGCDRDYIGSRIETIFVNGVAIDSLTTILHPGATVGLSAAMPGERFSAREECMPACVPDQSPPGKHSLKRPLSQCGFSIRWRPIWPDQSSAGAPSCVVRRLPGLSATGQASSWPEAAR